MTEQDSNPPEWANQYEYKSEFTEKVSKLFYYYQDKKGKMKMIQEGNIPVISRIIFNIRIWLHPVKK